MRFSLEEEVDNVRSIVRKRERDVPTVSEVRR